MLMIEFENLSTEYVNCLYSSTVTEVFGVYTIIVHRTMWYSVFKVYFTVLKSCYIPQPPSQLYCDYILTCTMYMMYNMKHVYSEGHSNKSVA